MKLANLFLGVAMPLIMLLGCTPNPCKEVSCENGACQEGTCLCFEGFEGPTCAVQMRNKFFGNWTIGDICNNASNVYDGSIQAGQGVNGIQILGLQQMSNTVQATIIGNELEIPLQVFGTWTIQGNGGMDTIANIVSIDYQLDYGNGFGLSCLASFTPR